CTHTAPPTTCTLSLHDALPIWQEVAIDVTGEVSFFREVSRRRTGGRHERQQRPVTQQDRRHQRRLKLHARVHDDDRGDPVTHRKDRKSTRLNSSHVKISYAVFC